MNFKTAWRACLVALAMVFVGAVSALAQVPTGSIVGTVLDAQKAAIVDADVTITSMDTGVTYKTKSGPNGGYSVSSLPGGLYRVDVSKDGFKAASVTNLKLDSSAQLSVPPVVMEVGAKTETVVVEAGASEEVQTTSAEVGDQVDKQQLDDLPVNGRQPESLIELEPGISFNGKTDTVIDGQRSAFTSVTLDGINIQDNFIRVNDTDFSPNQIFLSQTGEFHVNTQNGDPSVGGGSSAVSITTPRGTNSWHGQGFYYYQTNKWSANPWFNNANQNPNAVLNQNQRGGQAGGPAIKNKLFVYGSWEEQAVGASTNIVDQVFLPGSNPLLTNSPSFSYITNCGKGSAPACPAGFVNKQLVTIPNFLTFDNTSSGGAAPPITYDPAIIALLNRIPAAANLAANENITSGVGDGFNTGGFFHVSRNDALLKNTGGRADFTPTEHNSFSASYYWNRQIFDRPDIDQSFNTVPDVRNFDAINFMSTAWRFSPNANLTNEVRFGFDLAPATFRTSQQFGPSYITGVSFTTPDPNFFFQGRNTHTWSWQDNANMLHGNHSLSFGMQLQRVTIDAVNDAGAGTTNFAVGDAFSPFALVDSNFSNAGLPSISTADLGNANQILSTYAGWVDSLSQTFNVTSQTSGFVPGALEERNLRQNNWAFYGGDSWRYRPNLTFTLGLRYEYLSPFGEKDGLLLQPIPGFGQSMVQTLLSNATVSFVSGNTGRRAYNKDLHDFAPNIGIAWDPSGNGKMAVRAGYSIHYVNDDLATVVLNAANGNAGLSSSPQFNVDNSLSNDNGAAPVTLVTAPAFQIPTTFLANAEAVGVGNNAGFGIDPNLTTPYVQDWNLSIQREIGFKTTLTVSYLGNHGTNLIRGLDINQVIINQNGLLDSFNIARNNCFASIAANNGCNPFDTTDPGTITPPPGSLLFDGTGPNAVFQPVIAGSFLTSTIQGELKTGQVGSMSDLFHVFGVEDFPGQFTPNELIRGGDFITNFSSSTWHAGVVQVQRRFNNNLIFQSNYTFSKVIDDADGGQTNFQPFIDNANPRAARGRSNFDITHAWKTNFVYSLPFGKGQKMLSRGGIVNDVIGGWKVSSVVTFQSGAPFSIFSGRGTLNRAGRSGVETPDLTESLSQFHNGIGLSFPAGVTGPILFNPNLIGGDGRGVQPDALVCAPAPLVFCNPPAGQQGNFAKNAFNGPKFFNIDASILKGIPIRESINLELRLDAFNAINHPTFFAGDQNVNSQGFGVIQDTGGINGTISNGGGARVLQIGARLNF